MKKLVASLCATAAMTIGAGVALAHDDDDYYGGERGYYDNDYYGGDLYNRWISYWHECRRHARFHQRLRRAHEYADELGYDYYGEHRETHEELSEAHQRY